MTLLWVAATVRRDVSIVDWFWAAGFALLAWSLLFRAGEMSLRPKVVAAALTLWALRLGVHLYLRSRGKGEDPRYVAMRERSGASFTWISLGKVFWFQGLLIGIISAPVFVIVRAGDTPAWGLR